MANFICLINPKIRLEYILTSLSSHSILNYAILYESKNIIMCIFMETVKGNLIATADISNSQDIFYDKLKNLYGLAYKIPLCSEPPRVYFHNREVKSAMMTFMTVVAKLQNAVIKLYLLDDCFEILKFWKNRWMDLSLNTAISVSDASDPKLLTYEESGFCALIPLPQKKSLTQVIFTEPFDIYTWLCLLLSIVSSAVVWRMFRRHGAVDSHWLLIYGILVMFIGQGVDFSRKNRLVLGILLQSVVFMIFVLNSAYDGVITSFMIQPFHESRLETFEELLNSDYEIITSEAFAFIIKQSKDYDSIKSRLSESGRKFDAEFYREIERQEKVFIMDCKYGMEYILNKPMPNRRTVADYYYRLPTIIMPYYVRLEASYLNPFIDKFQYYMDLVFQAGLLHIWKIYALKDGHIKPHLHDLDDTIYIKLEDLYQVFCILLIGCILSCKLFLMEILFQKFLRFLNLAHLGKRLRNRVSNMASKRRQPRDSKYRRGALYYIIHRHQKAKRLQPRKRNVKQIFIQSRNVEV